MSDPHKTDIEHWAYKTEILLYTSYQKPTLNMKSKTAYTYNAEYSNKHKNI